MKLPVEIPKEVIEAAINTELQEELKHTRERLNRLEMVNASMDVGQRKVEQALLRALDFIKKNDLEEVYKSLDK